MMDTVRPSVTFVASSLRLSGGVLVVAQYASGLQRRGYHVTCIGSSGGAAPEVRQRLSPEIRVLSATTSLEQASSPRGKLRLAWQLARLVPPSSVIVATHTPTVVPVLLAHALWRRSARLGWFHQDWDEMFAGKPVERWLLRHGPARFERVITVSEACADEIERLSGVRPWVVPQGYAITEREPGRNRPAAGAQVVLFVGDPRPRKGWDDFVAAARLLHSDHPDLRLAIVTKEQAVPDLEVPHDLYIRPSWEELEGLYARCRVFVSASWWEGFGRPPLEAMAWGAPVVTTDSGGVREYARDGINCLMTPVRDPQALAAAIHRLLSDPELSARLGEAGRRTALGFTWERAVDRFAEALEADAEIRAEAVA